MKKLAMTVLAIASLNSVAVARDQTSALTVTTEPAQTRTVPRSIGGTGNVVPWKEVLVSSATSGVRIEDVAVEAGDKVHQGDVLATLDVRALSNAVRKAEATLTSATNARELAQSGVDRGAGLVSTKAASQESLEALQLTLKQADASLSQARASLEDARNDLAEATIKAPSGGTVLSVAVVSGAMSATGTTMFTIARDSRLELETLLPERFLSDVKIGQRATITGIDGRTENASVRLVLPMVDAATHLGKVRLALDPDTALRSGMFSRAAIEAEPETAMTVPHAAITWRDNASKVFVVRDGKSVSVDVVPGNSFEGRDSVTGDVREGDAVIVQGAGFVDDGNTVSVAGSAAK